MKTRLIFIGVIILMIAICIGSFRIYKTYVSGWNRSEAAVKKEYPVVKGIGHYMWTPTLTIIVYLHAPIDQQEAEDILNSVRANLLSEKMLQALIAYGRRLGWNAVYEGKNVIPSITVSFMYKNQQICSFGWTLNNDSWGIKYGDMPGQPYTPPPLMPPSAEASPAA